jgi:DNA-binding beta-propeller fold protein YncE
MATTLGVVLAATFATAAEGAPFGALTQLPGRLGCVRAAGRGCAVANVGVDSALAVSLDRRNLYVLGIDVEVFRRDPMTGAIRQLRGISGCLSADPFDVCQHLRAFDDLRAIATSPDGQHVYVASAPYEAASGAVTLLRRTPASGRLREVGGRSGCLSLTGRLGCNGARELRQPGAIAFSPDGDNLYVAAGEPAVGTYGALLTFKRDPATGELHQLDGPAGCISSRLRQGCARARALHDAISVAATQDGRNVYVASNDRESVLTFTRDPQTGALQQPAGQAGCVRRTGGLGCGRASGLARPGQVAISPDGMNVYTAGNRVAVLARDPVTGGLTQLPGQTGCIGSGSRLCSPPRALEISDTLAVSAEGRNVYVSAEGPPLQAWGGVAAFARDPATGTLHQLPGRAACIGVPERRGCATGRGLNETSSLTTSPDGHNVYTTSSSLSGGLAIFARSPG